MEKLLVLAKMMVVMLCVCVMVSPAWAGIKMELDDQTKGEIGLWTQAWYQFVEDGKGDEDLSDFMIRRAYMYLKGQVAEHVSFFTHVASDRVGQDGLDNSSMGLGSGVAWRDLWLTVELCPALKVQAGRMYIPLTRNYGTTSTKAMLTTDLPFLQGGVRGSIFYASKVGRDHLGLGSVSSDQILPTLSPAVNVLTIHPRYHSFYTFLLDEFWQRDRPRSRDPAGNYGRALNRRSVGRC